MLFLGFRRACIACVLGTPLLAQQPPFLVSDINATPLSPGAYPSEFTRFGNEVYFAATTLLSGRELFRTSGLYEQPQTTDLCCDIAVGPADSNPEELLVVGGLLYFSADDGASGRELWRSDGTAAGTFRVRDIHPTGSAHPRDLTAHAGRLFFTAEDGVHGRELWVSDGTTAGTTLVADIAVGGGTSSPNDLLSHGAWLYFAATEATYGRELWRSDGTTSGTQRVTDIAPGNSNANPNALHSVGSHVVFVATALGTGSEVWSSDGTASGTTLLRDFEPGSASSFAILFTRVGAELYFFTRYRELWRSDGTVAGTTQIASGLSYPHQAVAFGNALIFVMRELSGNGSALWRIDGTAASLQRLSSGWTSYGLTELTTIGSTLWFQASLTAVSNQGALWKSDGTPAGTVQVATIHRAWPNVGGGPTGFAEAANGRVVFAADDGDHGVEAWASDGTMTGTRLLRDLGVDLTRSVSSQPRILLDLLGTTLLVADDGIHGAELWATDGTIQGTQLLRDIHPGRDASMITECVRVGTRAFFTADDGAHGYELWVTDGTPGGTHLVADLLPGPMSSGAAYLTAYAGAVFFAAHDGVAPGLWRSDGSLLGTQRLATIQAQNLRVAADRLYFAGEDSIVGSELWWSDGTPQGTQLLADIDPIVTARGPASSTPREFTLFNGAIYFVAGHSNFGYGDLWKTDGTASGTQLVADIVQGGLDTPHSLTPTSQRLFFIVSEFPSLRSLLWCSDGTTAGTQFITQRVQDVRALVRLSDRVLLNGRSGFQSELWLSDGTDAGTQMVLDINGSASGDPIYLTAVGTRRVIFAATETSHGQEPWITDGTAAGTRRIADLAAFPATSSSAPNGFTLARGRVLFAADDGALGRELWSYFPGASATVFGDGCAAVGRAPRLAATDPVLGSNAALYAQDVPSAALAVVLISNGRALPFPELGGCALYLDLASTFLATTFTTAGPEWSLTLPVPQGGFLIGARGLVQVAYLSAGASFALSNGVDLALGL